MAETTISAATAAQEPAAQLFQKEVYHAMEHEDFFSQYGLVGPAGSSAPIVKVSDFVKQKGDAVNMQFALNPDDAPIAGDGWIEDNEMSMDFDSNYARLDAISGAMRSAGKLTEQRAIFNLREQMKLALADWWIKKKTQWIFKQLYGTSFYGVPGTARGTRGSASTVIGDAGVTNTNILYGGDASSTTSIDDTDILTPDLIGIAKLSAQNGAISSTTTIHKMRQAKVGGQFRYVLLANGYAMYDFKKSEEWKKAAYYADVRGKDNPVFTGEAKIWDGVLIIEVDIDYLPLLTDWGSNGITSGAISLLLGANAAGYVLGQDGPDWVEDKFNYGRKWGIATGMLMGCKKMQFALTTRGATKYDLGVVAIKTAARHPKL
jgi:N4-gp56 family major capsid protein